MFVLQSLGCSRSWTSCSSDPEWILVEGQSKALQWANRPTELGWASMSQNLSLAKNPIIDRIEADPIHWQMKNLPFSHSEKPRKEEESLRQELGKQARRRG
ncbi:hypothetical protein L1987_89913 [Smallanthus sonchifolius]|nr:hypothetical protein L1987_89913 [Smallanthus sonchifolius]